ncbi:MAG: HDOD domain-containing protein [Bradymonadales bacterium]|nr:MAG: HDOD domain-containing protein [Bradymonadales bacterium]
MTKKTDPNYGKGEAVAAEEDSLSPYIRQVKVRVKEAVQSESFEIPLLPHVATQVLQLANNPNSGFTEIERILKQDQVLATHVIKVSNSAYYRGLSEVVSLRDAMSRIGLKTLKDVVFSLSLHSKVFRVKAYEKALKDIWTHSVACAGISQILAQYAGLNADTAFLAGLVHDIGKPVLIQVVSGWELELLKPKPESPEEKKIRLWGTPEQKAQLLKKNARPDATRLHEVFEEVLLPTVFNDYHTSVGALVAAKWKLPQEIFESIRWHHQPKSASIDSKMIQVIYLANRLCHHFGYGHEEDPFILKHESSFAELKIPEAKIEKIGTDLPKLIDSLVEAMAT